MENIFQKDTIQRVSAQDFAYLEIKRKILEGTYRPGQPIVEEDLCETLEISRTPLRGALQKLEFENLVIRKSNGRLQIAPISIQELQEIFEVRSKLEEIAVVQATKNATEEDLRLLSNIVFMIKHTYGNGNIDEILYYGSKFHQYIYDLSRNKTVNNILTQLNDHIHRYRRLVPEDNIDRVIEAGEEHEVILEYMKNKDAEGAKQAMTNHIEKSIQAAVKRIQSNEFVLDENVEE